jgi:Flp pilus assembly pilin Flp
MIQAISTIRTRFQNLYRNEKGAIAFEYLLVLAGVSVAIISTVALAVPDFTDAVIAGTCGAIDALGTVTMDCS